MTSLKITLLPLTICLLLSLNSRVSGKPSPKHLLIETKENAKKMPRRANAKNLKNSDYDNNAGTINSVDYNAKAKAKVKKNSDYDINAGSFHNGPGGLVVSQDYDVNSGVLNNNG